MIKQSHTGSVLPLFGERPFRSVLTSSTPTLETTVTRFSPRSTVPTLLRSIALVILGSASMAAAAHVQAPFWPVKLSMQSLVAIMIGMRLGPRLGGAALMAYVAEGAAGLPVFQSGAGIAYLVGPTGGFLLGLLLAAILVGHAAERSAFARLWTTVLAVTGAMAAIYVPGVLWLTVLFGPEKATQYGLVPFMPGELVKAAIIVTLSPYLTTRAIKRGPTEN